MSQLLGYKCELKIIVFSKYCVCIHIDLPSGQPNDFVFLMNTKGSIGIMNTKGSIGTMDMEDSSGDEDDSLTTTNHPIVRRYNSEQGVGEYVSEDEIEDYEEDYER
jgi:hypothetical protein